MTRFRPCIDLHEGCVKQIVGGSLSDQGDGLQTNFESQQSAAFYAEMYRRDNLRGGHVIKLGSGNDEAALSALKAYPEGLQVGGGINLENASAWIDAGASHVIVTSWFFDDKGRFLLERAEQLAKRIGRSRVVIDLSCKRVASGWVVAMNRWQTLTNLEISRETLEKLAEFCDELLVHAADVEGKCEGIDEALVSFLADSSPIPSTYAGGVSSFADLEGVQSLSRGRVDLTIGSALDVFGGSLVNYSDCVAWNGRKAEMGKRK